MAASAIYFFKLFLLSSKQVRKSVGLLQRSKNVIQKTSKLIIRPHHDHCQITCEQAQNFAFDQEVESFQYNASLLYKS